MGGCGRIWNSTDFQILNTTLANSWTMTRTSRTIVEGDKGMLRERGRMRGSVWGKSALKVVEGGGGICGKNVAQEFLLKFSLALFCAQKVCADSAMT